MPCRKAGTLTLQITPTATFSHQRHANVYRHSHAFTASNAHGSPIEQRSPQDVLMTFPCDATELHNVGITENWLKPFPCRKCHPLWDQLISPNRPNALFIPNGGFSNGCAFDHNRR